MTTSQWMNGSETIIVEPTLVTSSSALKKQAKQKNLARRGSSFTLEEDKILCSAFPNISKDPITRVNQSTGGYYKRIHEYFCKHKPDSSRSQLAITHRWQVIQKAVNKFCACKSAVYRRNESGKCEQDRIEDAIMMYENKEPEETFNFMHCWKLIYKEAKWSDRMLEPNRPSPTMKPATTPSTPTENENDTISRPKGRDSAKKGRQMEEILLPPLARR